MISEIRKRKTIRQQLLLCVRAFIYFSKRFLNTFSYVCRKSIWRTNNLLTVDILAYLPMNLSREVEEIEGEFLDADAL